LIHWDHSPPNFGPQPDAVMKRRHDGRCWVLNYGAQRSIEGAVGSDEMNAERELPIDAVAIAAMDSPS